MARALDDLMRGTEKDRASYESRARELTRQGLATVTGGQLEATAEGEKVVERARKEQQQAEKRAMANAEREQRATQRDRDKANREEAARLKGDAVAFFFDRAIGKVRPITAPSGAPMRKWGKSGTMFDPVTGKAYVRDDHGKLIEQDPEKTGETVKKDGHVYKVVPGMAWKWAGYDPDAKLKPDAELKENLAERTRQLKAAASDATGELSLLGRDIASDRGRMKDIERQLADITVDGDKREALEQEKTQLEGTIKAKVERQAQAELDAYKAKAQVSIQRDLAEGLLQQDVADKAKLIYREETLPNTGRMPERTAAVNGYISDLAMTLAGFELTSSPIEPAPPDLMESLWNEFQAKDAATGAAIKEGFKRAQDEASSRANVNQWTRAVLGGRESAQVAKLSAEAPIALPEKVRKATGVTHAQPEWFTPEAMERQVTAKVARQTSIEAPPGYKLEGGVLYATKETSSKFWGVTLPWTKKTVEEPIGRFKFDQYGVGYVELDPNAQQSPSFAAGQYYRGMPEYVGMPGDFVESFKKSAMGGTPLVPEVRRELEARDWQKEAEAAWLGRRWGAERLRDTLDQWQAATDGERAAIIAQIDPRQAGVEPSQRRLDTNYLHLTGQLSKQDARMFEKVAYGTEPGFAGVEDAFNEWAKTSTSDAAEAYRKAKASEPKRSLWDVALGMVLPKTALFGSAAGVETGKFLTGKSGEGVLGAATNRLVSAAGEAIGEPERIAAVNDYAAREAFMAEYAQEAQRRVDFNLPAFIEARDKLLGDHNLPGRAKNWLNGTLQNAYGSSVGMGAGVAKLLADDVAQGWGFSPLLSDAERELIGAQTIAWQNNLNRAVKDRMPDSIGEALLMASPSSYLWNLGGVRDKMWGGETGTALKKEIEALQDGLHSGRMTEAEFRDRAARIKVAADNYHALSGGGRFTWENDLLNPRSSMAQALAGYQQTLSPSYWTAFEAAALNSQFDLEIQKKAMDYASANGTIAESSYFGPFRQALIGGQVAPLQQMGIEVVSQLTGVVAGKMFTVGKFIASGERFGLTLNRAGREISRLENLGEKFFKLGKVERPIGGTLTVGQQARNFAVDLAKQGWASGGGEMFEEMVATFGQSGATFGDAVAQGLAGFIGGVGMAGPHAAVGYGLGQWDIAKMRAAQEKALKQHVADHNTRHPEQPISYQQAKTMQEYQSPQVVGELKGRLARLVETDAELARRLKGLAPTATVLNPNGGGLVEVANPEIAAVAGQRSALMVEYASILADLAGIGEGSRRAVHELGGVAESDRQAIDAAIRMVSGTPLTPAQEQALLNSGAYVRGNKIILPDIFREKVAKVAPETAKAYFSKTEADQLAEAVEAGMPAAVPPVAQAPVAKPVVQAPAKPAEKAAKPLESAKKGTGKPVGAVPKATKKAAPQAVEPAQTPVAAPPVGGQGPTSPAATEDGQKPVAPAAGAGRKWRATLTYTPKGSTWDVTVTQEGEAGSPEAAQRLFGARAKALARVAEGEVAISNIENIEGGESNGQVQTGQAQAVVPQASAEDQVRVSSEVERQSHKLEAKGSSPSPATTEQAAPTAVEAKPAPKAKADYAKRLGDRKALAGFIADNTEVAPETGATGSVFSEPVNGNTAIRMFGAAVLQKAFIGGKSQVPAVVSERVHVNADWTRVVTADELARMTGDMRATFKPLDSGGMVYDPVGKRVLVDRAKLAENLAGLPADKRKDKIRVIWREEVLHAATNGVRTPEQLAADWKVLPEDAQRRVVMAYHSKALSENGGDWKKVAASVPPDVLALEFWRMYVSAKYDGATTEQVDMAETVDAVAARNPGLAARIAEVLRDVARWLRDELLGTLDADTRAEFEAVAAAIEAEAARLEGAESEQAPAGRAEAAGGMETAPRGGNVAQAGAEAQQSAVAERIDQPAEPQDPEAAKKTRYEAARAKFRQYLPKVAASSQRPSIVKLTAAIRAVYGEVEKQREAFLADVVDAARKAGGRPAKELFEKAVKMPETAFSKLGRSPKIPSDLLRATVEAPAGSAEAARRVASKFIRAMEAKGYSIYTPGGVADIVDRHLDAASAYKDIALKFVKDGAGLDPVVKEVLIIQPAMLRAKDELYRFYGRSREAERRLKAEHRTQEAAILKKARRQAVAVWQKLATDAYLEDAKPAMNRLISVQSSEDASLTSSGVSGSSRPESAIERAFALFSSLPIQEDTTGEGSKRQPIISTANISDYAGNVDVSGLAAYPEALQDAFAFSPWDAVEGRVRVVPLATLISHKNELQDARFLAGEKPDPRQTAANWMLKAIEKDPSAKKRAPLDVADNGDGTFTIIDGNATAQAAMLAGWTKIPVRVVNQGVVGAAAERPAAGIAITPESLAAMTELMDAAWDVGVNTPEKLAADLVKEFPGLITPKILGQVWMNGSNTDPDVQVSWSEVFRQATEGQQDAAPSTPETPSAEQPAEQPAPPEKIRRGDVIEWTDDQGQKKTGTVAMVLNSMEVDVRASRVVSHEIYYTEKHGDVYQRNNPRKVVAEATLEDGYVAFESWTGTLGVPRKDMPQVPTDSRGALVNFLEARGIKVSNETVRAVTLKPTQAEYSPAKVTKAAERMEGTQRKILVSQDGYLLDGHHQWLASRAMGVRQDVEIMRLNVPVREALAALAEFPSTEGGHNAPTHVDQPSVGTETAANTPQERAAAAIKAIIQEGREFDWRELFRITDEAWGGTQADGTYTVKDAYDAMELAVNQHLAESGLSPQAPRGLERALRDLQGLISKLPTQSKRTQEAVDMQQFSTPPPLAFLANWVANIQPGEVMMEPSAGIGGLAVFARNAGATVIVNELSPRRREFLKAMGFPYLFGENAEKLNNILGPRWRSGELPRPKVSVLNPPFSNAAKSGKRGDTKIGAEHVMAALASIEDGGRVVAIVGEGMGFDTPTFRQWWRSVAKKYHVRANIWLDGKNYAKYGTTFSNRLLVIDKVKPPEGVGIEQAVTGEVDDLAQAGMLLEGVRNDRPGRSTNQKSPAERGGGGADAAIRGGSGNAGGNAGGRTGVVGNDEGAGGRRDGGGTVGGQSDESANDFSSSGERGGRRRSGGGRKSGGSRAKDSSSADAKPDQRGQRPGEAGVSGSGTAETTGVKLGTAEAAERREIVNEDDIFAEYQPAKVRVEGAKPLPGKLVESAAMASVLPPDPTYTPNLPSEAITEGRLSITALENIVYAGQAHEQILPNGDRRGYFIGDGTGVGKGRQISGIILDNWRQGRTKAVWVSKSPDLMRDAQRDVADVGGMPADKLFAPKANAPIERNDGVAFVSYPALSKDHVDLLTQEDVDRFWKTIDSNESRLGRLAKWLGRDFDGVIAFDEAHKAGNAIATRGARGVQQPSRAGVAVVDLQKVLPKARVVYVSATGATEVENLSYADRLGIWGQNTPFATKQAFFQQIRAAGLSALEITARDLKAMGVYMARSISFKGIEFDRVTHNLTPEQEAMYDRMAFAWQTVLANVDEALNETGGANHGRAAGAAKSAFWGAQQRFFNQLLTSLQAPSLFNDMDKQLTEGKSAVLQLVNTGGAIEGRAVQAARREAEDNNKDAALEDLDLSPKEILLQYIEKSFPTTLYEPVADPNNPDRTIWAPVLDAAGKRVQSEAALAAKQDLLLKIATLAVPDGILKQVLDRYGPQNVAEVTGRNMRVVKVKDAQGNEKTINEKRSAAKNLSETDEFNAGKRRILIFSEAGGTGFSFHASEKFKNQEQRVHYIVQAGWRADVALQGTGRTHRTGQVIEPIYKLCETNVKGHKRFIASIARRLAQMGAVTRGERSAAGQGMFTEADNLENEYATGALHRLIFDLHAERNVGDFTFNEFSEGLGFVRTRGGEQSNDLVFEESGRPNEEKFPTIQQFLNRILALPLRRQNTLFDLFMERMERAIEQAKAAGTYDEGTQIYKAKRIEKVSDEVVADLTNGAAPTRLVTVNVVDDVVFTPFDFKPRKGKAADDWLFARNRRSGKVYAFAEMGNTTDDRTGAVTTIYWRYGVASFKTLKESEMNFEEGEMVDGKIVGAGNYEKLTQEEAQQLWEAETKAHPKERSHEATFLVGAMLPVWDRIGLSYPRIFRFTTNEGEQLIGVDVPRKEVPGVRVRMGAKNTITPEAAFALVMDDGARLELANGWSIERRLVSGQRRAEINGLDYAQARRFTTDFGGISETIGYRPRLFIPDAESMAKVMEQSPLTKINGDDVSGQAPAAGVVGASSARIADAQVEDNHQQLDWLVDAARARGYESFNVFLAQEPDRLDALMAEWRSNHPRTEGSDAGSGSEVAQDRGAGEEDRQRIEALVADNMGLAHHFADKYSNVRGVDFEDRLQEARLGLVAAANTFKPEFGVAFGAYASRVIKNTLNKLYYRQKAIATNEIGELDAPIGGEDGGTTGKDNVRAPQADGVSAEDLAVVREVIENLPAKPRRIWEAWISGQSWREIGEAEGVTHEGARKIAKATTNHLRAELAKRGIRSVADIFPTRDEFQEQASGRQAEPEDEEAAKVAARVAASAPRVEAVQASIDHDAEMAAAYRMQVANSRTAAGAFADLKNMGRMAAGLQARELYATMIQGRMDKLEFYAPGAKEVLLDNRRNEALVMATINGMMEQMRDDITRAFGYPKFWRKHKKRLDAFLDEFLPVAARLEVERIDDEGRFVFKTFNMRAGTIYSSKVQAMQLKEGDTVPTNEGVFFLGPEVEGGKHLLLQTITADVQQQIYDDFHAQYPEAAHYLDRWIMPGMEEARYMGPNGTMTAEFNRHALRDLFNQWPQELRDLFGPMPLPDMPYVEGYTPDVAEAKTLVAMIGSLLGRYKSGARKIKAGEARRSGNIKNLFDGFSIRAMEAHREKIRVKTRARLIEVAAKPLDSIPYEERGNYSPVDLTFDKLLDAIKLAKRLHPGAFPAITGALSPQDNAAMAKILGDAYRLRGRGLMVHKEVERELMLGAVRQVSNNILTKLLAGLLERVNAGRLATPRTTINNWFSNEMIKAVRVANRLFHAVFSLLAGDVRAARISGWEFTYLLRGFLADRMGRLTPGGKANRARINAIVPRQLFEDQTGLEAMEIDPNISIKQQVLRANLGGAAMQAMNYGGIDVAQKQQMAYAAYRAHAQVAWADAKRRGEIAEGTDRKAWQKDWMQNAPADFHHDVYLTTVLYLMDYQNVPAWLDPQQSMTATGQIFKRALLPFAKWPYNMARQFKRLSFDAAIATFSRGKTKQQRIEGMANLATMAGLTALGVAIAMADDDDDPLLGKSLDEEGNLLDAAFRTANRINLSRLMRIVWAHGLMNDVDFTWDDGSGEPKDLYWRYRNYPYLKEAIAIGLFLTGKAGNGQDQLTDLMGEYVSFGILASFWPAAMTPFDQGKTWGYRATEGLYDFTTSGIMPSPWRQFITRMVDPVTRRTRKSEALGYEAGPIDAIRVNTPFLSKTVPSTGTRTPSAFAPFSAEQWFKTREAAIKKEGTPAADKKANIEALRRQAQKLNMPVQEQVEIFRAEGLPVAKINMKATSDIPAAQKIRTLRDLGVGPESFGVSERKTKSGGKVPTLSIPDPATVGYQPRGLQALGFFSGANMMLSPRQTIYRDEEPAE